MGEITEAIDAGDASLTPHDLAATCARLRAQATYLAHGQHAITLIRNAALRIVLVELRAGAELHEHHTASPISIYAVHGRVWLHVRDQEVILPAGALITLPANAPHGVVAQEDSGVLVTIPWRDRKRPTTT